jgi:hypothetical protein
MTSLSQPCGMRVVVSFDLGPGQTLELPDPMAMYQDHGAMLRE